MQLANFVGAAVLVAAAALSSGASAANLVLNGGFETGDFTDWTLTGNTGSIYVGSSPNAPHSGSFDAQLGTVGSDNFMTQDLTTASGHNYAIDFWHIYASNAGPPGDFSVLWNGTTVFGPVDTTSPPSPLVWTEYRVNVVGSGSDVLTFVSRNDPSYQGLDDVSVTPGAAVPESQTWALMLVGFGGLGAALRSRRKHDTAIALA